MNTRDRAKKNLDAEEEVMAVLDRNHALANAVVSDTESYDDLEKLKRACLPLATRLLNSCNRLEPEMKDATFRLREVMRGMGAMP